MSVWHVEECRHTQVRYTTPCHFDMWKNADIPRSDIHPSLIEPSATEPYYTRSVSHVEECRCTQVRWIKPSGTEPYYTRSCWPPSLNQTSHYRVLPHNVSLTCGTVQTYPGQMQPHLHHPHSSNLVLQSPTTPCQFDMWKNADVPRSDVPPTSRAI